ncbi:MAG TPA: flagellar biosynthesis protein FlhF, partial [Burkholderiaceae bacterium]|nr:flagellar biosynthesis protein FlhF [Burkholderiaceae bacterium]
MNVKRFTARTSRDALILVRQALGEDAVVLSTKPSIDGIEVLAMAPEGMRQIERMAATPPAAPAPAAAPAKSLAARSAARAEPSAAPTEVADDVARLSMSTLSFQDYVRERLLRRRQNAINPRDARAEAPSVPAHHVANERVAAQPAAAMPRAEPEPTPAAAPASVLEQRMSDRTPAAAPSLRDVQR